MTTTSWALHASFVHPSGFDVLWDEFCEAVTAIDAAAEADVGWMTEGDSAWRDLAELRPWLGGHGDAPPFVVSFHRLFSGAFVKFEYVPRSPGRSMYAGRQGVLTCRDEVLSDDDHLRIVRIVESIAVSLGWPQGCLLVEPIGATRTAMPMYMDWGERWGVTSLQAREFCLADSLFTTWLGGIGAAAYWLGEPFSQRVVPPVEDGLAWRSYSNGVWLSVAHPTQARPQEMARLGEIVSPLLVSPERLNDHRHVLTHQRPTP